MGAGCTAGNGNGRGGDEDTAGDGSVEDALDGELSGDVGAEGDGGGEYDWRPPFQDALPSGSVITPEQGGTISTYDGSISVTLLPGAVAEPVVVNLYANPGLPLPPADMVDLGLRVEVDVRDAGGSPVRELLLPAYIHFAYEDPESMIGSVSSLVVYGHSSPSGEDGDGAGGGAGVGNGESEDGEWHPLPTALSTANGTAMGVTEHFSSFGLFMPALGGALGCYAPGRCVTVISEHDPIRSMGMDGAGNLYFMYGSGTHIYRKPAGGGPESVEAFFDVRQAYEGTWLYENKIVVSPDSGNVYLLRKRKVFKITPNGNWSLLFPSESDSAVEVHAAWINPNDGALWVQCRESFTTDTLKQLNPESGQVTREVAFSSTTRSLDLNHCSWVFDSQGRLFSMRWSGLYVLNTPDDPTERWHLVTEGFVVSPRGYGRALAADRDGRVYAAGVLPICKEQDCQAEVEAAALASSFITVVGGSGGVGGGSGPMVIGTIRGQGRPASLLVAKNSLLVSSGMQISAVPVGRIDPSDGQASGLTTSMIGSISGKGSYVSLQGTVSANAPSHGVWLGDVRLRLAQVLPGELRFLIPNYGYGWDNIEHNLPDLGREVRMTLPSGGLVATLNGSSVELGSVETPEPGNYKSAYYNQAEGQGSCYSTDLGSGWILRPPLELATGEWMIWTPLQSPDWSWEITSRDGLFPKWQATEKGPWLAYQFNTPGTYVFDWVKGGETLECQVRVSAGGASAYRTDLNVDPTVGGVFYSNGASLRIPAGALPGTEPYQVRIRTSNPTPPQSDVPEPASAEDRYRYAFSITPQPDQLNGTIRFGISGGVGGGGTGGPLPVFYDSGMNSAVPASWQQSIYLPLEYETGGEGGRVNLVLRAGDYSSDEPILDRESQGTALKSGGQPNVGHRIRAKVNEITANLWWKVGLPDEKVEDDHFTILYNTRDGITADKALVAHEGLTMARSRFKSMGFAVPDWVIVTIDRNLDAEGSTSGLGRIGHWNMTLAGWLADEDLRSVAAHELFHIIQYENMSYGARVRKFEWNWWLEGSAVWAEHLLFPGENSAADWVKAGADFIHAGLYNYDSLSDEQAYACVALVDFLEKEHPGAVLSIFGKLGAFTAPDDAMVEVVGGIGTFMEEFAMAYFSQKDAPYSGWDLTKAFRPPMVVEAPATVLINRNMPALSAIAVKVSANGDVGTVPVSFTEATGSVVRPVHCSGMDTTTVIDKAGLVMGTIAGTLVPEGIVLAKAATFTPDKQFMVLYSNGSADSCIPKIIYEIPTITSVTPQSFYYKSPVTLQVAGSGFGSASAPFKVEIFSREYPYQSWFGDVFNVNIPANSFTPMTVDVRVRHKADILSNIKSVTITGDDD